MKLGDIVYKGRFDIYDNLIGVEENTITEIIINGEGTHYRCNGDVLSWEYFETKEELFDYYYDWFKKEYERKIELLNKFKLEEKE